jgi:acetylornithine/N-succinyldiaminopimelate aminotransferase
VYLGQKLEELRQKNPIITETRGMGLLRAFDLSKEVAGDVMLRCAEEGLLINMVSPTTVRLMPPLIITEEHVDEAVSIIEDVLGEF